MADLGVKLNQLDLPYQGIFPRLLAGKFDFIATTLLISPTDSKRVAFTMPIAEGSSSILKRKGDARIKGVDDLNGKVVGAQLGTPSERMLRDMSAKYKSQGKAGFELKLCRDELPVRDLGMSRQIERSASGRVEDRNIPDQRAKIARRGFASDTESRDRRGHSPA